MNLDNVTRDDWIVGGLALLLAICLLVLPWFDITVGVGAFSVSATATATDAPDGWLGILAFIAVLAVIADLAVERLSPQTELPGLGSRTNTRFVIACIAAGFVALKFLFHIHFSLFGWGFYANVIIAAALVYFAAQARLEAHATTAGASRPAAPSSPAAAGPTDPPAGLGGRSTPPPGS